MRCTVRQGVHRSGRGRRRQRGATAVPTGRGCGPLGFQSPHTAERSNRQQLQQPQRPHCSAMGPQPAGQRLGALRRAEQCAGRRPTRNRTLGHAELACLGALRFAVVASPPCQPRSYCNDLISRFGHRSGGHLLLCGPAPAALAAWTVGGGKAMVRPLRSQAVTAVQWAERALPVDASAELPLSDPKFGGPQRHRRQFHLIPEGSH